MDNVINIKPSSNVAEALRTIADEIDEGVYPDDGCTLIIGTDVFHLGGVDDKRAVCDAIVDMNFGIHKLMQIYSTFMDTSNEKRNGAD